MFHSMKMYGMHNGASAADWLGTAATAAKVASALIESVRSDRSILVVTDLQRAKASLKQAQDEIDVVCERLGITL